MEITRYKKENYVAEGKGVRDLEEVGQHFGTYTKELPPKQCGKQDGPLQQDHLLRMPWQIWPDRKEKRSHGKNQE